MGTIVAINQSCLYVIKKTDWIPNVEKDNGTFCVSKPDHLITVESIPYKTVCADGDSVLQVTRTTVQN